MYCICWFDGNSGVAAVAPRDLVLVHIARRNLAENRGPVLFSYVCVWPAKMADFAGLSFQEALKRWFHGDSAVVGAATKDLLANQTG